MPNVPWTLQIGKVPNLSRTSEEEKSCNCSARLERILAPKRSLVNTLIGMSQLYEKFLSATA